MHHDTTRRLEKDLATCDALVVDGNPTSRAILVSQLRDFGVATIVQASRLSDARRHLEYRSFELVLCEQHFANESSSGQDLLDDLRRNHLLPFSTIFLMVTGEATYAKVAEAAESALDGYLLKPHTAANLGERLRQARARKAALQDIFSAIEAEDFERAAALCVERFRSKGPFWLYAARVGAELLLRTEQYAEAQELYEAVVAAKTLPWAKLGVARAQLDAGQAGPASTALENLIGENPTYADAYDVLGRAQFELGKLDRALATFKMASDLTPSSVSRLQNLGMVTFYSGDHAGAEAVLERTVRAGLDSKMFDAQTLVLLAFSRIEGNDRRALQRCIDDFTRLLEKQDTPRHRRLHEVVQTLGHIQQGQFAQAVESVRTMARAIRGEDFDFEAASNLLALLGQLANRAIRLDEVETMVDTLGLRFSTTRIVGELLAGACAHHLDYAQRIHAAQAQVLRTAENAVALSMGGDPQAAVEELLRHGQATLNAKLIDTAHLVLQRYADRIDNAAELQVQVQQLRARYGSGARRVAGLGDSRRQAGGLSLRTEGRIDPRARFKDKGRAGEPMFLVR